MNVIAATLTFALTLFAQAAGAQQISAQRLSDMTRELASEPYAGRGPGGPGEGKTVDFIVGQFKALGLEPAGDNGGWVQAVPLRRYQTQAGGTFTLSAGGQTFIPGPILSTKMACDGLADENRFLQALQTTESAVVAGEILTLTGAQVLAFARTAD